ncbi:hypothetical protein GCM10027059_50180 [Myceligenerans halotolerans]
MRQSTTSPGPTPGAPSAAPVSSSEHELGTSLDARLDADDIESPWYDPDDPFHADLIEEEARSRT